MRYFQLFKEEISKDDLISFLNAYGIKSLDDSLVFTKQHLISMRTVEKIKALRPLLEKYYFPCKAKIYLANITENKCITILRQVIRMFGYVLIGKEKSVDKIKEIYYQIKSVDELQAHARFNNTSNVVLEFT